MGSAHTDFTGQLVTDEVAQVRVSPEWSSSLPSCAVGRRQAWTRGSVSLRAERCRVVQQPLPRWLVPGMGEGRAHHTLGRLLLHLEVSHTFSKENS